jgi:hypothetical protein
MNYKLLVVPKTLIVKAAFKASRQCNVFRRFSYSEEGAVMTNPVRLVAVFAFVLSVVLSNSVVQASYPCGIYARIDRVEVGPDSEKPTWVKVWGDFMVIKTSGRLEDVSRGYLYFSLVKNKEQHCRIEWSDLQEIAKTTQYVALGSVHTERFDRPETGVAPPRGASSPEVYGKADKDPKPFPYPLNWGLSRLRTRPDNDLFGSADDADSLKVNPVLALQRYLKQHPVEKS